MTKILSAAAALLAFGAVALGSAAPAAAGPGLNPPNFPLIAKPVPLKPHVPHKPHHPYKPYYGHGYGGGAVAAGLIGGMALGAMAASQAGAAPAYADEGECWIERRKVLTRSGYYVLRRVQVCE